MIDPFLSQLYSSLLGTALKMDWREWAKAGRWNERDKDETVQSPSQRWIQNWILGLGKAMRARIGSCMMMSSVCIDGELPNPLEESVQNFAHSSFLRRCWHSSSFKAFSIPPLTLSSPSTSPSPPFQSLIEHNFPPFIRLPFLRNSSSNSQLQFRQHRFEGIGVDWFRLPGFISGQGSESEHGNEGMRDSKGCQVGFLSWVSSLLYSLKATGPENEWVMICLGKWWEASEEVDGGICERSQLDQIDNSSLSTQAPFSTLYFRTPHLLSHATISFSTRNNRVIEISPRIWKNGNWQKL